MPSKSSRSLLCLSSVLAFALVEFHATGEVTAEEITHAFLACGKQTRIVNGDGEITWRYPHSTRDGYVLPNGNILLTLSRSKDHKGGAVIEVQPDDTEVLIWEGTQKEVNGAQPTESGTYVITEAGPKPRLLEVSRNGKVQVEFPLLCQKYNYHLQTRMARKLADGTYLVPHLLDFAVINYDQSGKVLSRIDTTVSGDVERSIHSWPFTAIRHGRGNTLVCCTNGNRVVDYDLDGKIAWQVTNKDFAKPWLQDPCGGQVLPNGNVVVSSYAAGKKDPDAPKLIELNRDKEVVWTYSDGQLVGIHHFQILETNGRKLAGGALK